MSLNFVVFIIGGGWGIGVVIVKLFVKYGYDVCINYKLDYVSVE